MTPELLREAGQLLYGDRWQSALADALGVRRDTVRRWGARENIPEGAWSDIVALVTARRSAIAAWCEANAIRP
jgi:DNA-binding transcriptional regulator YiaG